MRFTDERIRARYRGSNTVQEHNEPAFFAQYLAGWRDAEVAMAPDLNHANAKWRDYEEHFILPCFKWAAEVGFDLQAAIHENPGSNCVKLLIEHLRSRLP